MVPFYRQPVVCLMVLISCVGSVGCGAQARDASKTPRTAIEQMLLSQGVERSLTFLTVPLPRDESVTVDGLGLTGDQEFMLKAVGERLSQIGYRVVPLDQKPKYLARVVLQGFGTEQGQSFFGMPPVQSLLIPIALPEIALYKKDHQRGLVRWALNLYRVDSNKLIARTPWYEASTHYNHVVILVFLSYISTDLELPHEHLFHR